MFKACVARVPNLGTRKQTHRFVAVTAVSLLGVIVLAAPARAHALVESTTPAADETADASPERVTIEFSEPVEVNFGGIRVYDTDANRVDSGVTEHVPDRPDAISASLNPNLADGTYTVTWRVVSADGHPISEGFVFHVGAPGENPAGIAEDVLGEESSTTTGFIFGVARWMVFLGLLGLAGIFLFALLVWFRTRMFEEPEVGSTFARRTRVLLVVTSVLLAVGTVASFVLQGAVAGGLPIGEAFGPDVLGEVAQTRYGAMGLVRMGLLALVLVCWRFGLRPVLTSEDRSVGAAAAREPSAMTWLGAAASIAMLATPGLAGHASTTSPVVLNLISDVAHLVAASAWVGGLIVLTYAAFPSTRALSENARTGLMSDVVGRFSSIALISVAVIVATGTFRTWMEIGGLDGFIEAPYGHVLLVKLIVFVPLLVLGAINNRFMLPRIKASKGSGDDAGPATSRLKRLVAIEVVLATGVLALTALLVNLPPSRVAAENDGPFIKDVALGDYNLNVLVDPNEVGDNEVHLTATENSQPAAVKAMRVQFRMPEEDIGPLNARGRKLAPGHYIVEGRQLSVEGVWQLEIIARTSAFDEERTTVSLEVNG